MTALRVRVAGAFGAAALLMSGAGCTPGPRPPGPARPDGAGCSPGTTTLPNGVWFGFATQVTTSGFVFDLACMFTGTEAPIAAREDAALPASPYQSWAPPGYHIRNRSGQQRTLRYAASPFLVVSTLAGPLTTSVVSPSGFVSVAQRRVGYLGVWATVSNGRVTAVVSQHYDVPPPVPDPSGCTPGTVSSLPNGRWFGYTRSVGTTTLSFDLACKYSGDNANYAALQDGSGDLPVPNDYYIRNSQPTLRTLALSPSAVYRELPNPGNPAPTTVTRSVFAAHVAALARPVPVWVSVSGGKVARVEEQYFP